MIIIIKLLLFNYYYCFINRYWNNMRLFILSHISKSEFDVMVLSYLSKDKLHLHNNLIVNILNNIDKTKNQK
jgi:hypothetical protein